MSFGALPMPFPLFGLFRQVCSVVLKQAAQSASGFGYQTTATTLTNIPCSLQAMSTGRSMLYKAEGQTTVLDLYLPTRIENGSAGGPLVIPVGTEFVVDSVSYRSVGEGLPQGNGGVQVVPVERLDR